MPFWFLSAQLSAYQALSKVIEVTNKTLTLNKQGQTKTSAALLTIKTNILLRLCIRL